MRIVVIGTAGAGKTTLSREIARRLHLRHIEIDAINWQSGWRDLVRNDPETFVRRVTEAIQVESWVADGNYSLVRDILWRRGTHLVWLDYERRVVMARVIVRSLVRVVRRTELWAGTGNRERWHGLWRASHPIRWAWNTWSTLRRETLERIERAEHRHLLILRLRRPAEAGPAIDLLATVADAERGE